MEGEISGVDDLEDVQEEVPFLIFVPQELEIRDATYRKEGNKWATIRYFCDVGDETLRVKEFFLDWFYPGFPKSLMDSFVSSYGLVKSRNIGDRVIFYGRNYKNKEASSSFALGTQIEVEGETSGRVTKLSESLIAPYSKKRFESYPFHRRSFFARGGKPEWFEEERIARMRWDRPPDNICIGELCADSLGVFQRDEETLEYILVFSDDYYRRAVWVDSAKSSSSEDHLFYELRKDGNFFDELAENGSKLAFRKNDGPAIVQTRNDLRLTTITFSPLFSALQIKSLIDDLTKIEEKLENFI